MKNEKHRTIKSITRKALFISMILHVIFLITLFYFSVSNRPIPYLQDKFDVELSKVPRTLVKKPLKIPVPQQRKATLFEPSKSPLTKIESITPQITFQPQVIPTSPIIEAQPRIEQTDTNPDVSVDISTAVRELNQVEEGLSKTEAAQPTVGDTFGSKRSTAPGVQRKSTRSTLDVAETIDGDDLPTTIGDIYGNSTTVPYIPFGTVMKSLASEIVETSEGGPIDVVFVVDASGSMGDNIEAVADHIGDMVDIYKSSDIDYALGLTEFATRQSKSRKKKNFIKVFQLTKKLSEFKQNLYAIVPKGDEKALDAIAQTVNEMRFRATSKKHLIIVTDEPFNSLEGLTVNDSIALCREFGIYVNVLGLPNKQHRSLASETDGKWHAIPQDPKKQQAARRNYTPPTLKGKTVSLRTAEWKNVQKIGKAVLQNAVDVPVDIVIFLDGSMSMEDKLPQFLQQLDFWARDWDNALIDYQIGVVRFRARGAFNMVNVYNPPQSLDQIRKIAELPCQEDENLLHAVIDGLERIKLRPNAQTHLILITDEPVGKKSSSPAVIQFLEEKHVVVSVVGTYDDFQQEVVNKTGGVWVPIPEGHVKDNLHW